MFLVSVLAFNSFLLNTFTIEEKENDKCLEQTFSKIYEKKIWGQRGPSLSGFGSTYENTKAIRKILPSLCKKYDVQTIVDLGCGDFYWMKFLKLELNIQNYYGIDIVDSVVQVNKEKYEDDKYKFIKLDCTQTLVPKADLVLCRDVFVHLPYQYIFKALRLLKKSGCKYILMTTFVNRNNKNIVPGNYRTLDFMKEPFNFPYPKELINEEFYGFDQRYTDKSLGLWKLDDLLLENQEQE